VPIDSKAGNEQASVCKVQIKGVTMATSHITCHQEAVEGAKPKAKAAKLCKALDHKSKTRATRAKLGPQNYNYARPWQSSAGQQQISQLILIIDNLIKAEHTVNP